MNEDFWRISVGAGARRGLGTSSGDMEADLIVGWYAVELVAGHTYAFDLERPLDASPAREAPMLGIYSRAGALVADTRGRDFATRSSRKMTFTPWETGTYYLAAKGIDHETLAVWDAGPRAPCNSPANEGSVRAGATDLDQPKHSGKDLHGTRSALLYCRVGLGEPSDVASRWPAS